MQHQRGSDVAQLNGLVGLAVLSVPSGGHVLDFGGGLPSVARALVERGCRVWTVAPDERAALAAQPYSERVIVGAVEDEKLLHRFDGEVFDAILLLDVLGRVRDGVSVASLSRELLKPGGRVIASFALLDARGRFVNRQSAEALLHEAGLQIHERLDRIRQAPAALIDEFIVVASPASSAVRTVDVSRLQQETAFMGERIASLQAELTDRMNELHLKHQAVRQLQSDVAVREAFIAQLRAQAAGDRTTLNAVRGELQQAQAQTHARLLEVITELDRVKGELVAVREYSNAAGFRLVNSVSVRMRRHKWIYSGLQSLIRKIAPRSPAQ